MRGQMFCLERGKYTANLDSLSKYTTYNNTFMERRRLNKKTILSNKISRFSLPRRWFKFSWFPQCVLLVHEIADTAPTMQVFLHRNGVLMA